MPDVLHVVVLLGFSSLDRILNGTVNPSGKTPDTFTRDFTQTPYWNNFGLFVCDNMTEFHIDGNDPYVPGTMPHFVNYVEDIYVGYKYWETAAECVIDCNEVVQYPFGRRDFAYYSKECVFDEKSNCNAILLRNL